MIKAVNTRIANNTSRVRVVLSVSSTCVQMFTKSQFVLLLNLACGCLLSFSWTPQLVTRIRHPRVVKVNSIEHETSSEAKKICAAVIVPGFLSGAGDFAALAKCLTAQGIPTVVVPMPVWHWLPCLGGRSMRPILERIDHTVKVWSVARSQKPKI